MNTIFNNSSNENIPDESNANNKSKKGGKLWQKVAFGSITGFLFGAGAIFGVDHLKAAHNDTNHENTDDDSAPTDPSTNDDTAALTDTASSADLDSNIDTDVAAGQYVDHNLGVSARTFAHAPSAVVYNHAPVAQVSDNMSFGEAFNDARHQVGPGGVFSWHSGIYGTYNEHEWDSMSDAQRSAFLRSIHPQVAVEHVRTDLLDEAHPDVVVNVNVNNYIPEEQSSQPDDLFPQDLDDDVHIVGYGFVNGHSAASLDLDDDGVADMVIIDIDDTGTVTDDDVMVYSDGTSETVGGDICGCGGEDEEDPIIDDGFNGQDPGIMNDGDDYVDDGVILL